MVLGHLGGHLGKNIKVNPYFTIFVVAIQSLNHVRLIVTPWTVACQASLSFTISGSLVKLMSIELMIPSNHLILCHPLLLCLSIFPTIMVFSNESALHIRWPKYCSLSFSISPSNEYESPPRVMKIETKINKCDLIKLKKGLHSKGNGKQNRVSLFK